MPTSLSRDDRLQIMELVCTFAWADLEIRDEERRFVDRLIERMELEDDRDIILQWLRSPPPAEEVDPTRIPRAHREIVLEAARELVAIDGDVDPNEQAQFELLEQLLV